MSKEYYNQKQAELVKDCDIPYRIGEKERTASGKNTENLLIDFLQKEFQEELFFKRIKSYKINSKEEFEKAPRSFFTDKSIPQTDIICYSSKDDIWKRSDGIEIIPYNKIKLVFEVKKKDVFNSFQQIITLSNYYNAVPLFFVNFRSKEVRKPVLETKFAKQILGNIGNKKDVRIYIFSRQNTTESKDIAKRLKEGAPEIIRIDGYEGQLEKLVRDIKEIVC